MRAVRPAPLTLLAALAALAVAAALFAIYVYPAQAQDGSAPAKPTGLYATASHNSVTLTWDDPQNDSITGYVILRRVRVNDTGGDFSVLVANTGSAAATYTDTTVAASATYTYRIKAINEHGTSERSRWFHIDIPAAPEPPEPVNSPATGAPAISGTVQVGEELTAGTSSIADEDGLEKAAFGYQWLAGDSDIAGAAGPTYTLADTDEGKTVRVRVSFTDDAGNDETLTSAPTDAVAAAEPTEPPAKPTDLSATATHNQVVLTWKDPNDDSITGYVILRRNRDTDAKGHFSELVADTETAATTYTDANVAAETRYTYRIMAINQYGASERSRWYHIATPAAPEPPPNNPATGSLSITGTVQVGETLTVDTSGVGDEDGRENATFSYQWLADGTAISGATAITYTPVEADEGKAITVQVSFTDDAGNDEALTSEATDAVAAAPAANNPATGAPTIRGTAQVGEMLAADTSGMSDADGLSNVSFSYQWLADDVEIAGATGSTYTLADSDEGKTVKVRVSFTDDAANPESLTSAATVAVEARPNSPATGAPTISGTAETGETLTAETSGIADADGLGNVQYEYQWLTDDAEIAGATSLTYTLVSAEEGKVIKVRVSFADDAGNEETLTSAATDAVAAAEPSEPPAKPSGLEATATHDQVALTWDDPGDDSITGYVVLRRIRVNDTGGEFSVLVPDTGSAAATYTDASVAAETPYTYRIKAINQYGASERSRWYHIDTQAPPGAEPGPADQAPANLTAVPADGQVVLSWDAPAEDADAVTGYQVLRAEGQGGLSTLVSDTGNTTTTYTDAKVADGYSYAYRVKAIRDGERSGASNEARVQLTPASPTGLAAETVAYNTVTLTWDEPQDDSITGYVVMRLDFVRSDMITLAADTGTADTGYTDETVEPETLYFYYVQAINPSGESELSDHAVARTPEAPDPALFAPSNLTVELAGEQVVLRWDAPAEDAGSVTGYEITRARGWDDPIVLVADTGSAATAHIDETADAPGESYAYRVKAVRNGERSQASEPVVIQLPGPPPSAPAGLIASFGVGGVLLSWQAPVEDAGAVMGYEVLRHQGGGELTTLVADTGNAATAYTDATAGGASERYAYRVRAIRGEERSADSNEARVQLPPAAPRRVESAAASDLVLLSWADPGDDSVTGYRILRRREVADVASDFLTLTEDTGTAETSYADDTVENGRVYVYRVLAIGPGGVSEPSRDVRVRTFAPVAPRERLTGPRVHVPSTLLSNLGQSTFDITRVVIGDRDAAQEFTTGPNDLGYNLRGVKLDVQAVAPAPEDVSVELWSATSDDPPAPDARIATLTHATGRWTTGENTFKAPTGTTLEAETTYFVFASYVGPVWSVDSAFNLNITTSASADTADTASAPGWSVGTRFLRTRTPSQGDWYELETPTSLKFAILGSYVVNPDTPGQNVSESGTDLDHDGDTTGRLAVGGSVTGNIANNDTDAFAVVLEAGHTYRFDLEGSDTGQGTLDDPKIKHIFTWDGNAITAVPDSSDQDSGEGQNSRLKAFTLPKDYHTGTYYIAVEEDGSDDSGTYRLSMEELFGSGYGRFMSLEGRLQPGGTLSGTLGVPTNYGTNSYYFALEDLEVGRYTVDFGTGGIDSIHHFLTDRNRTGYVELEDTWIIVDQAHGRRSFTFDVRPGMEGTHYVLLVMRRGNPADYTATLEKAMPSLSVGRTGVVGEVPADSEGFALYMEFFSVDLEAGQKYQVDIKGKHSADEECEDDDGNDEACTLDHTMLGNIQAPNGDYVGGDGNFDDTDDDIGGTVLHFYGGGGDRGNTRFTFTADQDGTHFLKVGGRLLRIEDGSGFRAGTFRLSVREVR